MTASDAESALRLLDEQEFAVVISDQKMPRMGGAELLAEARRRQPDAVTMIVTAFATFADAVEAINQGRVVRYIRKPWNREMLLCTLHDGVELFEKRRENRLLRQRLIREERNVIIGKLASGLVHDLANIAAVLSIVETLRDDWAKGIDLSEELATLRGGVQKYWALVDSLRFCGMGEEIRLEKSRRDVRDVVREVFQFSGNLSAVRILKKLELEPAAEAQPADVDGTAIFHALLNLMKNAAEASPNGRGEVRLRSSLDGGSIRIEVEDNGPGIPPELAARILEGFHSTKGHAGTGLGLLIARRIAEGHGGRLEFRNPAQGGCIFSIVLPAA
jgi:signal transduction histidine kinase